MSMKRDIVIVGGGAAGMMAAIKASEVLGRGDGITLLDRNDRLGRKIYLTGKGRGNITNMRSWSDFSTHVHPNPQFFKHAFHHFSNQDTCRFFESIGVPLTVGQGQRVFPASMKAPDIAQAMERRVKELGVEILYKTSWSKEMESVATIVATGGKSYPLTGSTGDGYAIAASFGHTVSPVFPSLTALLPRDYNHSLEGIELKNVALHLYVDKDLVQSEQGEMSFTDDGIEGALGYRVSRRAVWALDNGQKVDVAIDLKPALSIEKLAERIAREVIEMKGTPKIRTLLRSLMPEVLTVPFREAHPSLSIESLAEALKEWRFHIESYKGYERAVVTAGGVSLKELVAKTMASRLVEGLYFAGEVIDLDGDTGGYNLQIAFSTGALAGESAARYVIAKR